MHSPLIPQNLFMHMPNQIVFNLAFTTLKENWLIVSIVKTKWQTLDIGNSSHLKIYWCACQNTLHCVVRYIFKFLWCFHMYVPLSPHVPLDQNTMDAQWSLEYLVLPPNQGNARPFECQLLSYQVLGCEENNMWKHLESKWYQVLFGCKYIWRNQRD